MRDGSFKPGRFVDTIALPVQIFHPVFQQFSDKIGDPAFKPDEATIVAVSKLMTADMVIRSSENGTFSTFHPLLANLSGRPAGQWSSRGSLTLDGLVLKQINGCDVPLVCIKYKPRFGKGGCDPAVQAAYSIREFLTLFEARGSQAFRHPPHQRSPSSNRFLRNFAVLLSSSLATVPNSQYSALFSPTSSLFNNSTPSGLERPPLMGMVGFIVSHGHFTRSASPSQTWTATMNKSQRIRAFHPWRPPNPIPAFSPTLRDS